MTAGPEKKLTRRILVYLRTLPNSVWWKNHGGLYSKGRLDIDGCINGLFYTFEVKSPETSHGLTALQEKTLEEVQAAGGHAFAVWSLEDVQNVMRGFEVQRGAYDGQR